MANQMLAIYNSNGKMFSKPKVMSPKMRNVLKETTEVYNRMFAPTTFKVSVILQTKTGWKRI